MEVDVSCEGYEDICCLVEDGYIDISYLYLYPESFGLFFEMNGKLYPAKKDNNKFKAVQGVTSYKIVFLSGEQNPTDDLVETIKKYFFKKYTYKEICVLLKEQHNITLSVTSLRRILKKQNLKRKNFIESPKEFIAASIIQEVYNDGMNLGYRAMHQRLRHKYRLIVKQSTVLTFLRLIDPQGVEGRSRYKLKRRMYKVPGPNYLWHIDGYDKLKKFGFAIHGCTDGYSRNVMWLHVSTSNNNPTIIAYYYLQSIQSYNILPSMIRSDRGTENTLIDLLQMVLRYNHTDVKAGEKSFIKGKSTANERIEKYWRQLRNHTAEYYISIFKVMQDKTVLDIGNNIHIEVLRFCFGHLIQQSLDIAKKEWNEHRVRKQNGFYIPCGIPNVMYNWPRKYGAEDCSQKVIQQQVDILLNQYAQEPILYNPKIKLMIEMLIPNICPARNAE